MSETPNYPDQGLHFEQHLQREATAFVDGMKEAGLEPSEALVKAVAMRVVDAALKSYVEEATLVLVSHTESIQAVHRNYMKRIKQDAARRRFWLCSPVALIFSVLAWLNFAYASAVVGSIFAVGALAFLAMLILGAILDRPRA